MAQGIRIPGSGNAAGTASPPRRHDTVPRRHARRGRRPGIGLGAILAGTLATLALLGLMALLHG
ncbi:hypothetical protein [Falsiroseomonas oryzae]|uniref:hypothetical protein n=1 Tax=Falsiroseomonas oryzae TaxID=2766473 RepID=UPI0022EA74C5|nr:hypothetical protein [Roseomonas sp. MO-31]